MKRRNGGEGALKRALPHSFRFHRCIALGLAQRRDKYQLEFLQILDLSHITVLSNIFGTKVMLKVTASAADHRLLQTMPNAKALIHQHVITASSSPVIMSNTDHEMQQKDD